MLIVFGVASCDTEGEIIEGRTVSSIAPNSGAAGGNSPIIGGIYFDSSEGLTINDPGLAGDILVLNSDLTPEWVTATPEAALPVAGGTMLGNIALNDNFISGDGDDEGIFINSNGQVGIGTALPNEALHVVGNALKTSGGSAWQTLSDKRLKKEMGDYQKGLSEIKKLKIKEFRYLNNAKFNLSDRHLEQGVFAQEILNIFPEAIYTKEDFYYVNYHPIQMATINAIQDLAKENQELKKRIEKLEKLLGSKE